MGCEEDNGGNNLTHNKDMKDGPIVSGSYNWYFSLLEWQINSHFPAKERADAWNWEMNVSSFYPSMQRMSVFIAETNIYIYIFVLYTERAAPYFLEYKLVLY